MSRLPYLLVSLLVIAADQITKLLASERLAPLGSVRVIPGFLDLTYVRNPGGVFGLFKNLDSSIRDLLFTVVPVFAIALIATFAARVPSTHRLTQYSLSLILGGAVGNLVDRFTQGHVIDFLDFYWRDHHWPAFNVADSAICVGVGMLLLESFLATRRDEPEPAPPDTA